MTTADLFTAWPINVSGWSYQPDHRDITWRCPSCLDWQNLTSDRVLAEHTTSYLRGLLGEPIRARCPSSLGAPEGVWRMRSSFRA